MLSKFKVVAATIVAVAASVLLVSPADAGKKSAPPVKSVTPSPNSIKLEPGVWVAKVVGVPAQWNYVVSADPSGRHAAAFGTVDVGFYSPLDTMTDETSPLLIDVVMTGPATATFNSVWYGIRKVPGPVVSAEIVYIGVNRGVLKFVAPGKAEGTHNISYYWPYADGDGDGFPDPGAEPIAPTQTVYTVDTRLGQ
jgi:hypothetical protein